MAYPSFAAGDPLREGGGAPVGGDGAPRGGGATDDPQRVDGLGRLHLALPARPDLRRIREVLGSLEAPWLGEPLEGDGATREFACDLHLPVGDDEPSL